MAEPEVNVPGIGGVKRGWLIIGGLAVSAGVIYAYWRSSAGGTVPPSEGDILAEDLAYEPDAYAGATLPGGAAYDPDSEGNQTPLTNAEWTQRVVDMLVNISGYDPMQASTTVGKYLSGQPLTPAEKLLIQTAIALLGPPPAGQLPMIDAGTPPTGTTPPATGTKLATPTGLRVTVNRPGYFEFVWTRVPGATFYLVKKERPGADSTGPTVTTKKVGRHRERRGMTFWYRVQAHSPGKTPSSWSGPLTFKAA
jgi:hypothetical protein